MRSINYVVVLLLFCVGLCEAVQVTVTGGSGSGSYAAGDRFFVVADDAPAGQVFDYWSGDTASLGITNSPITMLIVPSGNVSISAVYRPVGTTPSVIDSAAYMNLVGSNQWTHVKYESKASGVDHVFTNTTTCLGEQLFNGSPAIALEELMNGQPFETAYYHLNATACLDVGRHDPDKGEDEIWLAGHEIVSLTNSFLDGVAYAFTFGTTEDPGMLFPATIRYFPNETVTVPAGTFSCVRSQMLITFGGGEWWFSENWYAPGVGRVKSHSVEGGYGEYVWELLGFEAAPANPDQDGDGLLDDWETRFFGASSNCVATADFDGDGHSNYQEFFCGTNPTNSASVFAVSMTSSGVSTNELSWYGVSNLFYQLESTDDLTSTNWVPIDYRIIEGTNGLIALSDAETATNRFYRVKVSDDNSVFPAPPLIAPAGMVVIPGGTNSGTDPDNRVYFLSVSSFFMDATEVTKEQWDAVYIWAVANGYSFDNIGSGKAPNHPVQTVSWYDCVKWCNARSEKEGRIPVYTASGNVYRAGKSDPEQNISVDGYRLPTKDEWEYAARGGLSDKRFPWGDTITHSQANYSSLSLHSYDISPTSGFHPSYSTDGYPYTNPVGSFSENGYGLYDMVGNVWEWCWDASGSNRSKKGGCWMDNSSWGRCSWGGVSVPHLNHYSSGFRTVCR